MPGGRSPPSRPTLPSAASPRSGLLVQTVRGRRRIRSSGAHIHELARGKPGHGSLNVAIAQLLIPAGKPHVPIPRSRGQRCGAVAISMLNRLARASGSEKTPFPESPAACPGDSRTGRAGRLWIGRVPDRNLESSCKVQLVRLVCVRGVGVPQEEPCVRHGARKQHAVPGCQPVVAGR